jgi:hypothetical protein
VIHRDPDEPFSASERRALSLWRAPEPPADLAARVVAGVRGPGIAARGAAYAALAVVVVAGFFAVRLMSAGAVSAPANVDDGQTLAGDGGASAEVSVRGDGVRS